MKRLLSIKLMAIAFAIGFLSLPLLAQEKVETTDVVYRRSSLHTVVLEGGNFLHKDLVMNAYNQAPFPDKYNDHRLPLNVIRLEDYGGLTPEEKAALNDTAVVDSDDKSKDSKKEALHTKAIEGFLNDNKIGNQMVAKWFSRDANGAFNMSMIHERGSYDASQMQAELAKGSVRGLASLKDAGEELISKTFVVVNKMNFVENEPIARATRDIAYLAASQIGNQIIKMATETAADIAYNLTKDGYSVWTISYLYQLKWDDEVANAFYETMWMDSASIDPAKKALFDETNMFKFNYVGFEKGKSLVLIGAGKDLNTIIQQATVRNIDKVYTKLQKAYDVFKTKTPIYSAEPLMAKIGMKEGVEANDKFEVLEMVYDSKTGLTKYQQVGIVKADKKNIWDNRYSMGVVDETEKDPTNTTIEGTYFTGGTKKIMPGMLLRQVK